MTTILDTETVPAGDVRIGDHLVSSGSDTHRVTDLRPYDGTAFGPEVRVAYCADGWAMTLSGPRYDILRRPDTTTGK